MRKYYTIDVVTPQNVIYAYRGNDKQNTIEHSLPEDNQAIANIQLPTNMTDDRLDNTLINTFLQIALANAGRCILIGVDDDKIARAWIIDLSITK